MSKLLADARAQDWTIGCAMPRERWISLIEWTTIIGIGLANVILARVTGISLRSR